MNPYLYTCPECGAEPGIDCEGTENPFDRQSWFHDERLELAGVASTDSDRGDA